MVRAHVLPEFYGRTLPIDTNVAQRCARLHIPDRCGERDALIAATALVHGMTVVTRNVADFQSTGAAIINPWEPANLVIKSILSWKIATTRAGSPSRGRQKT